MTPATTQTAAKRCHIGVQKVMTIGKVNVFAGGIWDVGYDFDWDLMLRFGERFDELPIPSAVRVNKTAQVFIPKTVSHVKLPPTIDVLWGDFDVPNLSREWWVHLNAAIKKMSGGKMVIHCQGGHGRTGTALAIFAGLNGFYDKKTTNPVAAIRSAYCHQAVEGTGLIDYIKWVTGLEFTAQGSWVYRGGWQVAPAKSYDTAGIDDVITIEPTKDGDDRLFTYGGEVYKERADGKLEFVGPDDGSYYGKNHAIGTGGQ